MFVCIRLLQLFCCSHLYMQNNFFSFSYNWKNLFNNAEDTHGNFQLCLQHGFLCPRSRAAHSCLLLSPTCSCLLPPQMEKIEAPLRRLTLPLPLVSFREKTDGWKCWQNDSAKTALVSRKLLRNYQMNPKSASAISTGFYAHGGSPLLRIGSASLE